MSNNTNKIQLDYITSIRNKITQNKSLNSIIFDPNLLNKTIVEFYYVKPVIVLAPDIQFKVFPKCNKCNLNTHSRGWEDSYQ
jgi:hypothetical protein